MYFCTCANVIFLLCLDLRVGKGYYTRMMATANGTCVNFCNQHKAHFDLPWVRPCDNRGKCHMDEKRIQCLSNASQHVGYPYIFNRFPVIQPVSPKVRHFSTFVLNILASPGFAAGTIAVIVTWMERRFNAGQTHSSIDPSNFNRLRAIARYWSEIATFPNHLHCCGCSHWNSGKSLVLRKLESWGYQAVKTV